MDLIGHCVVALNCGLHDEAEIFGSGLPEMMLPNILHCHDWAYETVWDISAVPETLHASARRIRSHIVADWVIHYGTTTTRTKRKCGWSYRKMGFVHRRMRTFFAQADGQGLLSCRAALPDRWTKKRKLDFAHSIVEYAIDLVLARKVMSPDAFNSAKRSLAALDSSASGTAREDLWNLFTSLGAWSDLDEQALGRSIDGMAYDAATAEKPEDFAIATTIRKYGFNDGLAARRYVGDFLQRTAAELDDADIWSLIQDISKVARNPVAIYDGPLKMPACG